MIIPGKSYRINLIRNLREREKRDERNRRLQITVGIACFALLALSLAYAGLAIWKMQGVLKDEARKVSELRKEYRKYTETRAIVDKGDVELLYSLQGRGIFWTKKLAALATHLPENYSITGFSFRENELHVVGQGLATGRQDHLLVLNEYLGKLRSDTSFSNDFRKISLNNAERYEESGTSRIGFAFTAQLPKKRKRN